MQKGDSYSINPIRNVFSFVLLSENIGIEQLFVKS